MRSSAQRRSGSASDRRATIAAWTLSLAAVAAVLATLALRIADAGALAALPPDRQPSAGIAAAVVDVLLVTAFAAVGAFVASHRPGNPVGWLLCGFPALLAVGLLGEALSWRATLSGDERSAALGLWIANCWWTPAVYMVFVFLPLLFPTGRPLTPRWRIVTRLAGAGLAVLFVGTAFRPGPLESFDWVENPLGLAGVPAWLGWLGTAGWGACSVAAIASLVLRFRRSRHAERQQIKWLTAAAVLLLVCTVTSAALQDALGQDGAWALVALGLVGVDLAVAVAVLRYRLYDIDVVINRALVYGGLTATLAATYLAGVLLLQLLIGGVTRDSDLAVAGSTLATAALFRPARARIQQLVDRRFYRRRYDAQQTLQAFAARLRSEVALDAVSRELRAVAAETVQPAHVSVWLRHDPRRS